MKAAALLCLFSVLSAAPPLPAGWTEHYVLANGIRIHYWRTGGDKPVLVLLHGSSDDALCWTNLAKEFTSAYDIILLDARGHGRSDPPSLSDPLDAQVEDLAAVLRQLKLVKPILMGHSMGSSAVAWFAAKYPSIPRAIVLEDPNFATTTPPTPASEQDKEKARASILELNNMSEEQIVAQCLKLRPAWGLSECQYWAPSKRLHHPNTAMVARTRPPVTELFPKITCPTLILKADAPASQRLENERIARLLSQGKIVHIDGAGHNVRREGKAQTIEVLRSFLQGL
ncbi:MAG: alpha/beta hydrolase [Acidobacteria bacterium]|nr:alpha/beta hydrolase [Acidobacteriota bacterium]